MNKLSITLSEGYDYYGESESSPTIELKARIAGDDEKDIKHLTKQHVYDALDDVLAELIQKHTIKMWGMDSSGVDAAAEDYYNETVVVGLLEDPADPDTPKLNPMILTGSTCAILWDELRKQAINRLLTNKKNWVCRKPYGSTTTAWTVQISLATQYVWDCHQDYEKSVPKQGQA